MTTILAGVSWYRNCSRINFFFFLSTGQWEGTHFFFFLKYYHLTVVPGHCSDLPEMNSCLVSWWHRVPKLGGWGRHNWWPFFKTPNAKYSEWARTQHSPGSPTAFDTVFFKNATGCPRNGKFRNGYKTCGKPLHHYGADWHSYRGSRILQNPFPAFVSPWFLRPGVRSRRAFKRAELSCFDGCWVKRVGLSARKLQVFHCGHQEAKNVSHR